MAQNTTQRRSAIYGGTRHAIWGSTVSHCIRKRTEETFGWCKTIRPLDEGQGLRCDSSESSVLLRLCGLQPCQLVQLHGGPTMTLGPGCRRKRLNGAPGRKLI